MDESYYRDLAERLAAAASSHKLGQRSVDYILRTEFRGGEREVGEYWMQLARKISQDMLALREQRLSGLASGQSAG